MPVTAADDIAVVVVVVDVAVEVVEVFVVRSCM